MDDIDCDVREMTADDYDAVADLWRTTEGVGLHDETDARRGITAHLARNPGLSFVARQDGRLVGAVLCGHDGRRGYLHHLAVALSQRRRGIGSALVESCLAALGEQGIRRCNIFLYATNELGATFWKQTGWNERADLKVLQRDTPGGSEQSVPAVGDDAAPATPSALMATLVEEAANCLTSGVAKIRHCVGQMSDEQVWWRPEPSMNAVGNLILHLCGNLRQWTVAGIGDQPDVRDRPSEFSERWAIPKAELLGRLDEVVAAATEVLSTLSPEDLLRVRRIQGFDVSALGAIFSSFPHFTGHVQEIVCLTRMQLGPDYRYDWVPATPEQGAPRDQ